MLCYVATKYEEKGLARDIMSRLVDAGHAITHDWTAVDEAADPYEAAKVDLEGVIDCDVLVIVPKPNCKGAWVEFGAALLSGCIIIVVTEKPYECIFEHMPGVFHVVGPGDVVPLLDGIIAGDSAGDLDGRN